MMWATLYLVALSKGPEATEGNARLQELVR
jgi:hypothetical protein